MLISISIVGNQENNHMLSIEGLQRPSKADQLTTIL